MSYASANADVAVTFEDSLKPPLSWARLDWFSFGQLDFFSFSRPILPSYSCFRHKKASNRLASLHYYPPHWTASRGFSLLYPHGPSSPSITLSFPRIVSPDADIAVCIREREAREGNGALLERSSFPIGSYIRTNTPYSGSQSTTKAAVSRLLVDIGAAQYSPEYIRTSR